MENNQKMQFGEILKDALGAYGKPLSADASILAAWWNRLQPYPLRVVQAAFQSYCDENGEFAPVPAGIAKRCKLMDGRPADDEAWAIALTSQDEADTVVWTSETAEAFALCLPVLREGDEVGARMAFKATYNRLVTEARLNSIPAKWSASLGWDMRKRESALTRASSTGLLSAPAVAALLPPPAAAPQNDDNARAQIEKIRQMMAVMNQEKATEAELHCQRERNATAEAKRRANEQVQQYRGAA